MLRVGLTGGIGSGKSAVANRFEKLGIKVSTPMSHPGPSYFLEVMLWRRSLSISEMMSC